MNLVLQRLAHDAHSTLGLLYIDGVLRCAVLEDEPREVKVPGETRIPAGRYRIDLRTEGGMHSRYQRRFSRLYKGMLWLRDVPGFEWIYIHVGNTHEDSRGCPLVGFQADLRRPFRVLQSEAAYRDIYPAIAEAAQAGDAWIEVRDEAA
ncbi:MAG TPA: DUF5675 family protein [Acidobacteriota bacterium]|nr:DUF5675 family protein [Acidobacteriota bacterium]